MRDDNYLQGRLDYLWDRYFADVGQNNDVVIRFGRKARGRLGSIKQELSKPISNSKFPLRLRSGQAISNKISNKDSGLLVDAVRLPRDHCRGARMTRGGEVLPISRTASKPVNPSVITINGLFKDTTIPEFLIDSVIAHEMVHYAHGFASPHEKKYATPHAGGIIKKEMQERGLEDLFILQKKWLKENWREYVDKHLPRKVRTRKRRRRLLFVLR